MQTYEFNLLTEDISELIIKEANDKKKCLIWDKSETKIYTDFILSENSKTKIICNINFFNSSKTGLYMPRPIFKKVDTDNNDKKTNVDKSIIISFGKSNEAIKFWELISFIMKFKKLVDTSEFEKKYTLAKDDYVIEFEDKEEKEKFNDIKELINRSNFSFDIIKELELNERKKNLKAFLFLLKNHMYQELTSFEKYNQKYNLKSNGEEKVWQHFLLNNRWILGLNTDIRIINGLLDEQDVGIKNNKGTGSPISDFLGISRYTTLIELKRASTTIFKKSKSKSRTNTWDFTSDFIEGFSQSLAQKIEFDKSYDNKDILDNGVIIDKNKIRTLDSKVYFIIGCREYEFPHNNENENIIKSETFERFKRNSKNIEIITFDELFERAYYIVFNKAPCDNWINDIDFEKSLD